MTLSHDKILSTVELNKQFYKIHQEEFSKSRRNSWDGWQKVTDIISTNIDKENVKILDLACGNGRFYNHLVSSLNKKFKYLGYDTNDYMLIEALLKYEEPEFKNLDIILEIAKITGSYDVVTAFGLTHHIPGKEYRLDWFKQVPSLVDDDGLFIFTTWQIDEDDRSEKLIAAKDLEDGDFYYGWNNSEDKRYVHIYSDDEINAINEFLNNNGFTLIESFEGDGKSSKLNKYFIYKKGKTN